MSSTANRGVVILSPVFNDWECAREIVRRIDRVLADADLDARILFVDDGSTDRATTEGWPEDLVRVSAVRVLSLRRNLGHQRAIAIGLCHLEHEASCDTVVVMDCDGEDRPEDIPRLLERVATENGRRLVFAERAKRLEKSSFQVLYHIYRQLHVVLTGIPVRVGNYSAIPFGVLRRLVVVSELWNHFAAAVFAAKLPYETVPADRGERISGESKLGFGALVVHGLSAISVHSERMAVRGLLAIGALLVVFVALLLVVLVIRLTTDLAIPGWASSIGLALLVLIAQLVTLSVAFVFAVLHRRTGAAFLPARDYSFFIDGVEDLVPERADR